MRKFLIAVFTLFVTNAGSQVVLDVSAPALPPPPPITTPVVLPLMESANELKGKVLVAAMRTGGYVLYLRHALQIPPTTVKCDGPSLTPVGEEQARKIGAAIRELKIPIGRIRSSEPCRNRDTARLLNLGAYEINQDLNPVAAREGVDIGVARHAQLAEPPPPGTNTLLVSHVHGSKNKSEWMHLEIAEIIVYRPDGKGGSSPVARVRLEGWGELIRIAGENRIQQGAGGFGQ